MNSLSGSTLNKTNAVLQNSHQTSTPAPTLKALGNSQNTELADWYEEAYAYYNRVQSGQEGKPESGVWNEFLNQMSWAYGQLMTPSPQTWDPVAPQNFAMDPNASIQSDPFGGVAGPANNWVHTSEQCRIGFNGEERRDIWSNDIDLEIAPLSAQVQVAKVMDENMEPPEEVLKVVVRDSATGTQATWVVHDYQDAQIRIHVPDVEGQVQDLTGLDPTPFTIEKFKQGSMAPNNPVANIPGVPLEDRENATLYEAYTNETVEFRLEPYGSAEEVQTHVVYGNTAIFTKPTDEVAVGQDENNVTLVTVTHRDGSQDILEIQEGYQVQIFAREETLTVDGQPFGSQEEIPEQYDDLLLINPESDSTTLPEDVSSYPGDTEPDTVENGIQYFNSSETVVVHNDYGKENRDYKITTGGTFELSALNYDDKVSVFITPEGNYRIVVENPNVEPNPEIDGGIVNEYFIQGPPSEILLNGFLPGRVTVYRSTHSNGGGGVEIWRYNEGAIGGYKDEDQSALAKIHLDSDDALTLDSIEEGTPGQSENLDRLETFLKVAGKNWEQLLAAIRAAGTGSFTDVADLKKAVQQGEFPFAVGANMDPSSLGKMIKIFYNLDSEFHSSVLGANQWESGVLSAQYHSAAERLVYLMTTLYPNNNISLNLSQPDPSHWWRNNEIVIDGTSYNFTSAKKGQTNVLEVSEAEVNEPHPG